MLLLLLSTVCLCCVAASHSDDVITVRAHWTLSTCDGTAVKNVKASVPGLVHTDLLAAGILQGDPYYRFNEKNWSWVPLSCWEYKSSAVNLQPLLPRWHTVSERTGIFLRLESVDTAADVFVNDVQVGVCNNAFHPHTFEVPHSVLSNGPDVVIRVVIHSALKTQADRAATYPYAVPETENYNVWAEPTHRNFLRKAGSDGGWDWGPAYSPAGILGELSFRKASLEGFMDEIMIDQRIVFASDARNEAEAEAFLDVSALISDFSSFRPVANSFEVAVSIDGAPIDATFSARYEEHVMDMNRALLDASSSPKSAAVMVGTVHIPKGSVKLWWPRGHGTANLYVVEVSRCHRPESLMHCE